MSPKKFQYLFGKTGPGRWPEAFAMFLAEALLNVASIGFPEPPWTPGLRPEAKSYRRWTKQTSSSVTWGPTLWLKKVQRTVE